MVRNSIWIYLDTLLNFFKLENEPRYTQLALLEYAKDLHLGAEWRIATLIKNNSNFHWFKQMFWSRSHREIIWWKFRRPGRFLFSLLKPGQIPRCIAIFSSNIILKIYNRSSGSKNFFMFGIPVNMIQMCFYIEVNSYDCGPLAKLL